jgi:tRNA modification GTPase
MTESIPITVVETIAAIATPPGRGGVGIIRISGPLTTQISHAVLGKLPHPRHAEYLPFLDAGGEVLDEGIALYFPAPHSFTGDDVLELQGHGGPVVMDLLLHRCTELGARIARAGEFSERAFLNDKLDLAQAEAIADLIDSSSEQGARAALRSLQGQFSHCVHAVVEETIQLRMYVEAAIDFPEEEIDFLSDEKLHNMMEHLLQEFNQLYQSVQQGCLLREGMTVVIAGQPNAGKSSLLNVLAGRESAIVTDVPGTTRDVLREHIQVDGMPVHIIDTAGLRESDDQVEKIGVRRAWDEIERADRVLLVVDDSSVHDIHGVSSQDREILQRLPAALALTIVRNKIDISNAKAAMVESDDATEILLSAKNGDGVSLLRNHLKQSMGYENIGDGVFMARRRHMDALQRAQQHLEQAHTQLQEFHAGELAAEELRQMQQVLSEITGEFSSDDLLGRIFSSFCIGK